MSHETDTPNELVLHEEELVVDRVVRDAGAARMRKTVEVEHVQTVVPTRVETADVERVPPYEDDSGEVETLPDGSVSIPILEEELVVTTRVVVRERLVVRKRVAEEARVVEADLRRERAEVETDEPGA